MCGVKRTVTQPCVVLGSADRATTFRDDLHRRGVRFVSLARSVGQLRRHLVLGEDASLVLCVLLSVDDLTTQDRQHIGRLLADRQGFATRVFCVGVLGESEDFARWASLGCDAYVADARSAVDVLRAVAESGRAVAAMPAQHLLRQPVVRGATSDSAAPLAVSTSTAATASVGGRIRASRARAVSSAGTRRGEEPPA